MRAKVEFSEGTLSRLLQDHPLLVDVDTTDMLNHSNILTRYTEDEIKSGTQRLYVMNSASYFLLPSVPFLKEYRRYGVDIPLEMQIYPDDEGVLYTMTLGEENGDFLKKASKSEQEPKEHYFLDESDRNTLELMKSTLGTGIEILKKNHLRSANIEIELVSFIKKKLKEAE